MKMLSTPKGKAELYLASSLYDGLEDNNIVQVTTLLLNKEADPNVLIPSQGITPFHLVIGNDSETFAEEVTKLFLRHGGNPNVKSTDGMTPVHVAAAWGRLDVLELLLSNGGDPLLVDDDGRSPFHYAFDEAHYDAVATLGKYCGESFEDNASPKYNIALDKILVSNRGVVAEYVVAEGTSAAITTDAMPTVCTSKIFRNNDDLLGNKLNKRSDYLSNENKRGSEWPVGYPARIDSTITTTTDESSSSLKKSSSVNRHRRCLPRRKLKNVEPKLTSDECKIEPREQNLDEKNIANGVAGNPFSVSHLNDAAIEASFVVKPRGAGESMPRISSPKADKNLVKSEYEVGNELCDNESGKIVSLCDKKISGKSKIVHKTPLRCRPSSKPFSERSKTPSAITEKRSNLNVKTTPKNKELLSNDKRALGFRTPNKNIFKQNSYSPDCSIVSKSPNLIITPTTPTNARYKIKTEISSTRDPRKKTAYTPSGITTPKKINNAGSGEKNFSRFVKQSDLRYRGTKKSPASSPNGFYKSPVWSKRYARTPNLTDSAKHARKFPIMERKIATTNSRSPARSPATPFNKTYSKKCEYLDAAGISPDVEVAARYIDRRTLAKSIAIKLEETRYDDECGRNAVNDDVLKNSEILKTGTGNRNHFKDPDAAENKISTDVDGRSNRREIINWDRETVNERNDSASVNKDGKGESKGVPFSGSYDFSRASRIMAGFFQPGNGNGESISTSTNDDIMNNAIVRQISRLCSNSAFINNFSVIKNSASFNTASSNDVDKKDNEIGCKLVITDRLETPNSKEIDDSLISSDASEYSLDNYTRNTADSLDSKYTGALTNVTDNSEGYRRYSGNTCENLPDNLSSVSGSSCTSFVSVEEEYKYEDAEEGIVLLERRLLVTPVSVSIMKSEDGVSYSSARSSVSFGDKSVESRISSLPQSLVFMDSETLRRELTKLQGGHPPGPITSSTRRVYLKRLWKLQKQGPIPSPCAIDSPPKFSAEIERTLRSENWMNDLSPYETLELQVFSEFAKPDPTRRWREGTTKSSFNYLLMDPRITDNLPRRADALSSIERWRTFLSSIFYVGKGKRSRPYAHLYEAYGELKKGNEIKTSDKKVERILNIWKNDYGVVCLHLFQNTIPVEAYTREAAMIEALRLERLTNSKSGEYYGVAATWSLHQKRTFGLYLLYKAMRILMNEGERQLYPDNIGRF